METRTDITGTWSALTDPIESNRRHIVLPEGTKRMLYSEWFVYRSRLYRRDFGSRMSRSPSPNRLKARTESKIARPGKMDMKGAVMMYCCASFSMAPHSGIGGYAPSPRKLRTAAARMESPRLNVA